MYVIDPDRLDFSDLRRVLRCTMIVIVHHTIVQCNNFFEIFFIFTPPAL